MSFEITKSKLLKKYTTDNGVTDVIVPDEVQSIGKTAFSHNPNIKISCDSRKSKKKSLYGAFLIVRIFRQFMYLSIIQIMQI